jgi:ribulose-phosphate 3-epimerase
MKPIIAASILSADFLHLEDQIKQTVEAGVDWLHIDVMDGSFVPNITMGPFIVEHCRRATNIPIDVHLMIQNPERHIDAFIKAGACSISIHQEACLNSIDSLEMIRKAGATPGIVINPDTEVDAITDALPHSDYVLVMTVHPGYSGQKFIPESIQRVTHVRSMIDRLNPLARLEVDGGINASNLATLRNAGADIFVTATAIYNNPDGIKSAVKELRDVLKQTDHL